MLRFKYFILFRKHTLLDRSLSISVQKKLKNSIFEMPVIPQVLNINNLGTASANSINLHANRIFFNKRSCKGNVYSYRF